VRVVIAGAGAVGSFLAQDLSNNGHEILVIDENPVAVERLVLDSKITGINGDACEVDVLQQADLAAADVVIAATGDDEDNLVISLLAKQEFAVPRVIARVNHPKNHWLFNDSWGVDVAVSTPHLLSALVEEAVSVGSIVHLLEFEDGQTRLVEVTLSESSPAARQTIDALTLPRGVAVVAVVREGRVVIPRGDTQLTEGDEVVLLVTDETEEKVRSLLVVT
jgi:trk system potassium uptake protein TrkA